MFINIKILLFILLMTITSAKLEMVYSMIVKGASAPVHADFKEENWKNRENSLTSVG